MITAPDSAVVDALHPSANFEPRQPGYRSDLLLLHYTGMQSVDKAIDWLARPESKVSCHYVVAEDGRVTQMVAESMRAWHAGRSCWQGVSDINSCSIGIEIQNPGHADGYPDFAPRQMSAVIALAADIVKRNRIGAARVLAHSDVAPERKIDPGEKFPWRDLHRAGIGLWVAPEPATPGCWSLEAGAQDVRIAEAQHLLRRLGYAIDATGVLDQHTAFVLRAFQLHWRPARVDSRLDRSTLATLRRLVAAADADGRVA